MASRVVEGRLVEEIEHGEVRRYKIIDLFEPKGRPPDAEEMAATDNVMLRTPPLGWSLDKHYRPRRTGGPAPT